MSSLPMIDPFASVSSLIEAVEQADTSTALLVATTRLASHLVGGNPPAPAAIAALVQVLGFNNPGAAVAAVDGLIACGETAVAPLLDNLDAHNYGARAWAVRALAGIGDVRGLELLAQALGGDIGPSVRRAAARGLGQLRCGGLPAEGQLIATTSAVLIGIHEVAAAGGAAAPARVFGHVVTFSTASDDFLRFEPLAKHVFQSLEVIVA